MYDTEGDLEDSDSDSDTFDSDSFASDEDQDGESAALAAAAAAVAAAAAGPNAALWTAAAAGEWSMEPPTALPRLSLLPRWVGMRAPRAGSAAPSGLLG